MLVASSAISGGKDCASENGMTSDSTPSDVSVAAQHPPLSEQEKLRPCFECHKDVTPQIYTEWYNSSHGIGNVKCYQCHGTYEDMYKVPAVSNCSMCHAREAQDYGDETPCWNCHLNHTFKGH
ncbi:MAG: hypothetical protein R6V18_02875 [Desulfuromonadaceae bacterium]